MPTLLSSIVDGLCIRILPRPNATVIGGLNKGEQVEFIDTSPNRKWFKIKKGKIIGWSYFSYLQEVVSAEETNTAQQKISNIAAASAISKYRWKDRGIAPLGYIKGMSLSFARAYCKLKTNDKYITEMAKANTGDKTKDALAHYASGFDALHLSNDASGADTLRHLFVLMLGLGMRESSGRYCEGRDRAAQNTTAETAEAGLFQTSYNARNSNALLPELFSDYRQKSDNGFLSVYEEGVTPKPKDLENFGAGDGLLFQQLSKESPNFAVMFAAVALRNQKSHWGPIKTKAAEIKLEADILLLQVQHEVDSNNYCPL